MNAVAELTRAPAAVARTSAGGPTYHHAGRPGWTIGVNTGGNQLGGGELTGHPSSLAVGVSPRSLMVGD